MAISLLIFLSHAPSKSFTNGFLGRRPWRSSSTFLPSIQRTQRISSAAPHCRHSARSLNPLSSLSLDRRSLSLQAGNNQEAPEGSASDEQVHCAAVLSSIEQSLAEHALPLVQDGAVMIVGVSGGCDSVGLIHALRRLNLPVKLHAVHFDHAQRGEESNQDRLFVEDLCCDLEVPLHIYHWDTNGYSSENTTFSQDLARKWRRDTMYELLQTLSKPNLTGIIATAHHRNDSTETLLLKLLRGVHVSNLVGMEEVSRPNDQPLAVWARPMLHISKNDMKQFLTSQALEWREDSSNDSSKYKRNRIRNELVPLLEDIVGSEELLAKRLENLSSQAKELRDDLLPRAKAYLLENNNTDSFILPEVMGLVEKQALHMWCSTRMHDYALPFNQLQRICRQLENYSDSRRWTLQVGSGWSVIRNRDVLSIIHDTSSPTPERSNASSPQCSNGPTAEHSNA